MSARSKCARPSILQGRAVWTGIEPGGANRIDVGNEVIVAGDLPGEPDLQIALRLGDLDAIGGSGSSSGQRSLDSMSEIRQIHTDQGS